MNDPNLSFHPLNWRLWPGKYFVRLLFWLVVMLAFGGIRSSQAQTILSTSLDQLSPAACPPGGCAAGQRLNFRVTYNLTGYDPNQSPNLRVCAYTPVNWSVSPMDWSLTGIITGASYEPVTNQCGPAPTGYLLSGGVQTSLSTSGYFGDALDFSLRIGNSATSNGSILVYTYIRGSAGWPEYPSHSDFVPLSVTPTQSTVFVANDAAACSINQPCYINSGSDLLTGLGTGLKDAIDSPPNPAQPATIVVLGNYLVKSNTVRVDKPHIIQGQGDASITYSGQLCNQPVLEFTAGGTLRGLSINDGSCTVLNRDLVVVNSPEDVLIEYNDLTGGQDAIRVLDQTGDALIRFNHISGNSGFAIWRSTGIPSGVVTAVGNNLFANREGAQVDCNNRGSVEHNFWGFGASAAASAFQCTVSEAKRLGAPVLLRANAPGVEAEIVTVSNQKTYSLNRKVAFQRSTTGTDFDLVLINHGFGTPENVPFTGGTPGSLTPCSNYYDIFLAENTTPPENLDLFFRYDLTAGCTATIENAQYCGGTDMTRYPLWWYDPSANLTDGWDTTGQTPAGSGAGGATGQQTVCSLVNKEIQVSIDASGRPGIINDLNFTPFVVGLPAQPSSVVLTQFQAVAGNSQAAIQWTTSSEINTSGFYLLRSPMESGSFTRVSDFIPRRGSGIGGAAYEVVDNNLATDTHFYRLEIVSDNLESAFSNVISVTLLSVTATPTVTPTMTVTQSPTGFTHTPTITATSTITQTRTITFTFVPTRTRTPIIFPTAVIRSPTPMPTRTRFPTRTPTQLTLAPTLSGIGGYPAPATITPAGTLPAEISPSPISEGTGHPVGEDLGTPTLESGYPAPTLEVLPSLTAALTLTATPEKPLPPGEEPGRPTGLFEITRRYWPYLVGLLAVVMILVTGGGFYLHRRGWLKFPLFHRPNKS